MIVWSNQNASDFFSQIVANPLFDILRTHYISCVCLFLRTTTKPADCQRLSRIIYSAFVHQKVTGSIWSSYWFISIENGLRWIIKWMQFRQFALKITRRLSRQRVQVVCVRVVCVKTKSLCNFCPKTFCDSHLFAICTDCSLVTHPIWLFTCTVEFAERINCALY